MQKGNGNNNNVQEKIQGLEYRLSSINSLAGMILYFVAGSGEGNDDSGEARKEGLLSRLQEFDDISVTIESKLMEILHVLEGNKEPEEDPKDVAIHSGCTTFNKRRGKPLPPDFECDINPDSREEREESHLPPFAPQHPSQFPPKEERGPIAPYASQIPPEEEEYMTPTPPRKAAKPKKLW